MRSSVKLSTLSVQVLASRRPALRAPPLRVPRRLRALRRRMSRARPARLPAGASGLVDRARGRVPWCLAPKQQERPRLALPRARANARVYPALPRRRGPCRRCRALAARSPCAPPRRAQGVGATSALRMAALDTDLGRPPAGSMISAWDFASQVPLSGAHSPPSPQRGPPCVCVRPSPTR